MERGTYRWEIVGYFCEVIGLMIWVGGLIMIVAVVIPAVFNSFGMEPAGRFLRRVFDGYSILTLGILVFLIGTAGIRYWYGHSSSHMVFPVIRMEILLLMGMAVTTFLIMGLLGPKAVVLQEQAFEAVSELEKQAAYDRFFRVHMIVRALHFVNVGFAVGLLVSKLRRGVLALVNSRRQLQDAS